MSTPAADTPAVTTPPPTATPAATGTPAAVLPVPAPVPSDGTPVDGANDVTITSTTDTIEQVQAALDHKVPDPAAAVGAGGGAPPVTPTTEAPPVTAPATPPVDPAVAEAAKTLSRRGKSLQERIDEVTFQREEGRRALEAQQAETARLKAENEAYRAGKQPPGATTPAAKPDAATTPRPALKQFQDNPDIVDPYEAYTSAVADWTAERAYEKAKAEMAADRQSDRARTDEERAAAANQQAMQVFGTRQASFRDTVGGETYDRVVNQIKAEIADGTREEQVYPSRLALHVTRSDMGPALIYHFAQHPEDFREIAAMHDPAPSLMLVALGRLEERLTSTYKPGKPGATTTPATPSTPAARAVDALASSSIAAAPVSTAPPPPTLVGSGPSATTVPLDQMPYQDYKAMRNAAERRRR